MNWKIQIKVSNSVVLKNRDKAETPVASLTKMLSEKFGDAIKVERQSPVSLTFTLVTDISETEIKSLVLSFLQSGYSAEEKDIFFDFEKDEPEEKADSFDIQKALSDLDAILDELTEDDGETAEVPSASEEVKEEKPVEKEKKPVKPARSPELEKAIGDIDGLVGCDSFKKLVNELVTVAPLVKENQTLDSFTHQAYIFSVNDGYGLTTCLEYFRSLIEALDLKRMSRRHFVVEEKIPAKVGNEDPFSSVKSTLRTGDDEALQVVCFDISEWLNKTDTTAFREFLHMLVKHMDEFIYIFRVPFVDKEVLARLQNSINDMIYVRAVSFPPLTAAELRLCAERELNKFGFRVSRAAWKFFDQRITEEKGDGRFYGINTVKKVVREMLYKKQLSNALRGKNDKLLSKQDVAALCMTCEDDSVSGWELLNQLVGAESVRDRIKEIVTQIDLARKNSGLRAPCIHMRFVGNPGTGKTTVARIVGKILREMGVLRLGNFFEYSGRDFVGRYIGETAPKTAGICRDAYGSVLFIDEAYSLYKGAEDKKDFGVEALDTLIAEMENHRTDLVVIMAGYPDEMEHLMKGNAGLASRVPYVVEFPNFTREELYNIFVSMVKKDFAYEDDLFEAAKEYFTSLPDEVLNAKSFSNARFVRNLYERVWAKAAMRVQLEQGSTVVLTKADFDRSVVDKEFTLMMHKKPKNRIGFGQ